MPIDEFAIAGLAVFRVGHGGGVRVGLNDALFQMITIACVRLLALASQARIWLLHVNSYSLRSARKQHTSASIHPVALEVYHPHYVESVKGRTDH
jgi:hypothetical protein